MEFMMGIFFVVLCLIVVLILSILNGALADINIITGDPPINSLLVAYKLYSGRCKSMTRLFTEVGELVPNGNILCMYFTRRTSQPDKPTLHYAVGGVLGEGNFCPSLEHVTLLESKGYSIVRLPKVKHGLYTTYPYKNKWSVVFAVSRVYPKLSSYMAKHNLCAHPMIEIYREKDILFFAPLSRQDEFYPPEMLEHDSDSGSDWSDSSDTYVTCYNDGQIDSHVWRRHSI